MTMEATLHSLSPDERQELLDWMAESRRRLRWRTAGFVTAVVVLVGAIAWTVAVNVSQSTTINRIVDSPCQRDASSSECQKLKIESDKARSARSACVITRLAGYPGCPALDGRRASVAAHAEGPSPGGAGEDAAAAAPGTDSAGPTTTSPPATSAPPDIPVDIPGDSPGDNGGNGDGPGTQPGPGGTGTTPTPGTVEQVTHDVGQAVDDVGGLADQVVCTTAPALCP